MEQNDFTITEQLSYLTKYWWALLAIALCNVLYEIALWEHIRKVALSQLVITVVTGFFWFNVYDIINTELNIRVYIATVILAVVLLINIGLLST